MNSPLTLERLLQVVRYDPESGEFYRLVAAGRQKPGRIAVRPGRHGYRSIGIDGQQYLAHRIAFFLMTGAWPDGHTDHIDGNKLNNRWVNLRDVPVSVNQQNRKRAQVNSSTGLLGVSWYPSRSKYCARIKVSGKYKNLGYFRTAEEAHEVYLKHKRALHVGCTI